MDSSVVVTACRNWGPAAPQPGRDDLVRLGQLALGDVEAPGGQRRAELHEHGPEVHLDGEGVVGAGAGHDRDDGDAQEVGGAEPVEEGLQEARVAGLVGGRGHDDQRAGPDPVDRLLHAGPRTSRTAAGPARRGRRSACRHRRARPRRPPPWRPLRQRERAATAPSGSRRRGRRAQGSGRAMGQPSAEWR